MGLKKVYACSKVGGERMGWLRNRERGREGIHVVK